MKIIRSDEEAVSPVIGVILMVAIVVILAAIIAAFVFGMVGTATTSKNVGLQMTLSQTVNSVDILFAGGSDLNSLRSIQVTSNGINSTAAGPATEYTWAAGIITPLPANSLFNVGDVATVRFAANPQGTRVMVIGSFADGSDQILIDRVM
jgi:archaeal type IV pilus assembly protein PilA